MSNAYLRLASQGKNDWWRYLLGSTLTLFLFIFGSTLTLGLFVLYVENDGSLATGLADPDAIAAGAPLFVGVPPLVLYIVYNLAFPFFLLGIYFALRLFHGRGLRSLITPYVRISWLRIVQGFSVFSLLKVLEILASYALSPEEFTLNFQLGSFLAFIPIIALLTPLQIATEELFFRGYLLQGIGYRLGKWPAIVLSSLLFALLHLSNPEVTTQKSWHGMASLAAYYFMIAAFLAWLTVKDNTLELALGVHAANNMATFLLLTSANSVIPSPAVFSVEALEASFSLVFFSAVWLLAFTFIVFRVLKRPAVSSSLP
ncbi:MAG: lysostaphin resistance A-like protein [Phormidesmis sp.]